MAPHDWTTEGSGAGDLKDVVRGGITANASHTFPSVLVCRCLVYEPVVVGQIPRGPGGQRSREYGWQTMCEAMPFWKGQEMKRSYYACISYVRAMRPLRLLLHQCFSWRCD